MAVSYVATTPTVYVTSESQTVTIPAVAVGDLLVATIMHRAPISAMAGWDFVRMATCFSGSLAQYTSVYTRSAKEGDSGASSTWSQAYSARLCVVISAYRSHYGCSVIASEVFSRNSVTSAANVCAMASLSSLSDGQMIVAAGSSVTTLFAPDQGVFSVSSGYNLISAASLVDNRIVVCNRQVPYPFTVLGQFTSNTLDDQENGWACVTILISANASTRRRIPLIIN